MWSAPARSPCSEARPPLAFSSIDALQSGAPRLGASARNVRSSGASFRCEAAIARAVAWHPAKGGMALERPDIGRKQAEADRAAAVADQVSGLATIRDHLSWCATHAPRSGAQTHRRRKGDSNLRSLSGVSQIRTVGAEKRH